MQYELVVGLEVHTELSTKSKIFCSCPTEFGGAPNTHCCPICMGMPGTLPVLNKSVVEYAMRAGIATHCEITKYNQFDRKNYFYPDLPKAYQISQLYLPICQNGQIVIDTQEGRKTIRIREIHMEEDAGKLVHDPWEDCTLADYNRCGVPLLEIVSQPDFRSPEEVIAYLEKLKSILQYIGVSDCKMQEGSLRADVNVSVRPVGSNAWGTRTEIKNMNSFKAIYRAITYEARRQIELLEEGKEVVQETRRWDENKDASFAMRSKEDAQDYRYFPEPDLPPVEIDDAWIDRIAASLPELPEEKRLRYIETLGLTQYDSEMITRHKAMADFFEAVLEQFSDAKEIANWIMGDLFRLLKERDKEPADMTLQPQMLADILVMRKEGHINRETAKKVLVEAFDQGVDPREYVRTHGLEMVQDDNAILQVVEQVIAENQASVADYLSGKEKAFGFLMGQCMRRLQGKANPATVQQLLKEKLK